MAARRLRRILAEDHLLRHDLLAEAPPIPAERLASCRVFPSREAMVAEIFPRGSRGVEVGTQSGAFARYLVDALDPVAVHVIDVTFDAFDTSFTQHDERLVCHQGLSWDVLRGFDDGSVDRIYIDASHAYADVVRDVEAAAPKVAAGGLLAFNDYTAWSPVEVAPYGVMRAVNELLQGEGWNVVGLGLQGLGYHDICLRRA